jgi:hypothetical protein
MEGIFRIQWQSFATFNTFTNLMTELELFPWSFAIAQFPQQHRKTEYINLRIMTME